MPGADYRRAVRLANRTQFQTVFSEGRSRNGVYLTVIARPNALAHARLGVAVSKKIARAAVRRNYMKRVLREVFRLSLARLPHADLVVVVRRAFTRPAHALVASEFQRLAGSAAR